METTVFPDEKYKRIWVWATIFTGISLVLNFAYMFFSSLSREFDFLEDLQYFCVKEVGLEFFSGFLFPLLSFIFILYLYSLSLKDKVNTDTIVIILMSFPIFLLDYINRTAAVLNDKADLLNDGLTIYWSFTIANIENNDIQFQLFLLPSFILLAVNLFLLIHIAPYKSGLFRKHYFHIGGSLREYLARTGKLFLSNFHFFYILIFNLMIYLLINKSSDLLYSDLLLDQIVFSVVAVILAVPAYTGFVMRFVTNNRLNARILSFVLGGLFTIMYPIRLYNKYESFAKGETYLIVIILLICLILGCFIGRSMGMVGYRLRGNQK